MSENENPIQDRNADFFITELAHMHDETEKYKSHLISVSKRVSVLEENAKGSYDDDPSKMMASVVGVIVLMQLLPVIVEMIQNWRGKKVA